MINFGIAVLVLIILVCLGIPVAYSMGLSSAFYILLADPQYLEILPNRSITGVNNFLLLAIPFFILASEIMGKTGLTSKLFNFARLFVGRFRGGLAFVNIIASTIFGSVSGSAIADVSGLGAIEIDAMTEQGYDRDFSIAISAGSSLQAPLIPPSTTVMIYAGVMGLSAGALLMGGVGPGILIALTQIIYVLCIRKKKNFPRDTQKYTLKEVLKIVLDGSDHPDAACDHHRRHPVRQGHRHRGGRHRRAVCADPGLCGVPQHEVEGPEGVPVEHLQIRGQPDADRGLCKCLLLGGRH